MGSELHCRESWSCTVVRAGHELRCRVNRTAVSWGFSSRCRVHRTAVSWELSMGSELHCPERWSCAALSWGSSSNRAAVWCEQSCGAV